MRRKIGFIVVLNLLIIGMVYMATSSYYRQNPVIATNQVEQKVYSTEWESIEDAQQWITWTAQKYANLNTDSSLSLVDYIQEQANMWGYSLCSALNTVTIKVDGKYYHIEPLSGEVVDNDKLLTETTTNITEHEKIIERIVEKPVLVDKIIVQDKYIEIPTTPKEWDSIGQAKDWVTQTAKGFTALQPNLCVPLVDYIQSRAIEQGYKVSHALVWEGKYYGSYLNIPQGHDGILVFVKGTFYYIEPQTGNTVKIIDCH